MKELSKEDQERIDKAAKQYDEGWSHENERDFIEGAKYEHHIAFEKGKIEGYQQGLKDAPQLIESAKKEIADLNFNEWIEAIKKILNHFNDKHEWSHDAKQAVWIMLEEIEKLKKLSNEKCTV